MFEFAEYSDKIVELENKAISLLNEAGVEYKLDKNDEDQTKLVFAGQYSAGKSTILKMLTGDESIEIGAGITTQKANEYEWKGMRVIDTPGIHTQLRPDHDAISYEAIANADMLVFVVTNELFDEFLAGHFRKLAIDRDKAGEMILVVNKMERTSLGNSPEQQDIISKDLEKVLTPYTPEQLNICFIDAESYLDSMNEEDPEIAEELLCRSGYERFVTVLNEFVASKGLSSKLTTRIYRIEDQLEKALESIESKDSDDDINALEEHFLQQKYTISDSRNRLQNEIKGIFEVAAAKIRSLGLNTSNLLFEGCKWEVVEQEFENSISEANALIEACQQDAKKAIDARLKEIDISIDEIENSVFSNKLKERLLEKYDLLPDNVKVILNKSSGIAKTAGGVVLKNAYNEGIQGGLKLTNFAKSNIHGVVLKIGHTVGYKFKPWQAVKITKGIAVGAQFLSIVGIGFEVYMQIKEDRDEDKRELELKNNRQIIRGQFYNAADELEEYGRCYVQENIIVPLDNSIHEINDSINYIRLGRNDKNELCKKIIDLEEECQNLIREIHSNIKSNYHLKEICFE